MVCCFSWWHISENILLCYASRAVFQTTEGCVTMCYVSRASEGCVTSHDDESWLISCSAISQVETNLLVSDFVQILRRQCNAIGQVEHLAWWHLTPEAVSVSLLQYLLPQSQIYLSFPKSQIYLFPQSQIYLSFSLFMEMESMDSPKTRMCLLVLGTFHPKLAKL